MITEFWTLIISLGQFTIATLCFPGLFILWLAWRVVRHNAVMAMPSLVDLDRIKRTARDKAEKELADIMKKGGEEHV
jgi:amino acid permease